MVASTCRHRLPRREPNSGIGPRVRRRRPTIGPCSARTPPFPSLVNPSSRTEDRLISRRARPSNLIPLRPGAAWNRALLPPLPLRRRQWRGVRTDRLRQRKPSLRRSVWAMRPSPRRGPCFPALETRPTPTRPRARRTITALASREGSAAIAGKGRSCATSRGLSVRERRRSKWERDGCVHDGRVGVADARGMMVAGRRRSPPSVGWRLRRWIGGRPLITVPGRPRRREGSFSVFQWANTPRLNPAR